MPGLHWDVTGSPRPPTEAGSSTPSLLSAQTTSQQGRGNNPGVRRQLRGPGRV